MRLWGQKALASTLALRRRVAPTVIKDVSFSSEPSAALRASSDDVEASCVTEQRDFGGRGRRSGGARRTPRRGGAPVRANRPRAELSSVRLLASSRGPPV